MSIESSGIKEAVILRQRSNGEYELLSGYRRQIWCVDAQAPGLGDVNYTEDQALRGSL